jgi:hypothetical protein
MLTLQDLLELDAIRDELANFAVRIGDLRDKARPDDDADPGLMVALRLSRVENAFFVLDGVLQDACAEAKAAASPAHSRDNVTPLRLASWSKRTIDA